MMPLLLRLYLLGTISSVQTCWYNGSFTSNIFLAWSMSFGSLVKKAETSASICGSVGIRNLEAISAEAID